MAVVMAGCSHELAEVKRPVPDSGDATAMDTAMPDTRTDRAPPDMALDGSADQTPPDQALPDKAVPAG